VRRQPRGRAGARDAGHGVAEDGEHVPPCSMAVPMKLLISSRAGTSAPVSRPEIVCWAFSGPMPRSPMSSVRQTEASLSPSWPERDLGNGRHYARVPEMTALHRPIQLPARTATDQEPMADSDPAFLSPGRILGQHDLLALPANVIGRNHRAAWRSPPSSREPGGGRAGSAGRRAWVPAQPLLRLAQDGFLARRSPPAPACAPTLRTSTRRSARCRLRGSGSRCTA
jgi:hypothetical protein